MSPQLSKELFEAANRRLFSQFHAKGLFQSRDYRPATGIGLFDLAYDIRQRRITVTVRVRFEFLGPSIAKPEYLNWKTQEKIDFRTKAKKVCTEAWSNKFKFECIKPGWKGLEAFVTVQMVEDDITPHYTIECRKQGRKDQGAWSGGCSHGVWPYRADFSNWGVETRKDFLGDQIFNTKEAQVKAYLSQNPALNIIPMTGEDPSNLTMNALTSLATKCGQVIGAEVPGLHCYVYGFAPGSSLAKKRAEKLCTRLNTLVPFSKEFFHPSTSSDSKNKAAEILRQANLNPTNFNGLVLFINVPPKAPRTAITNYIVITHEFGHMLGCPDEYVGVKCTGIESLMSLNELIPATLNSNFAEKGEFQLTQGRHFLSEQPMMTTDVNPLPVPVDNVLRSNRQQIAFASMLQQANVPAPYFNTAGFGVNSQEANDSNNFFYDERDRLKTQYGATSKEYLNFKANEEKIKIKPLAGSSDSIMFSGQKVLQAHYLTIWACLGSCTHEYVHPSEWAIVPC